MSRALYKDLTSPMPSPMNAPKATSSTVSPVLSCWCVIGGKRHFILGGFSSTREMLQDETDTGGPT